MHTAPEVLSKHASGVVFTLNMVLEHLLMVKDHKKLMVRAKSQSQNLQKVCTYTPHKRPTPEHLLIF